MSLCWIICLPYLLAFPEVNFLVFFPHSFTLIILCSSSISIIPFLVAYVLSLAASISMGSFCNKTVLDFILFPEIRHLLFSSHSVVLACCLSEPFFFFMESMSQSNCEIFPLFLELSFFPRMCVLVYFNSFPPLYC